MWSQQAAPSGESWIALTAPQSDVEVPELLAQLDHGRLQADLGFEVLTGGLTQVPTQLGLADGANQLVDEVQI